MELETSVKETKNGWV